MRTKRVFLYHIIHGLKGDNLYQFKAIKKMWICLYDQKHYFSPVEAKKASIIL